MYILWNTDILYLLNFLLQSNLYGKRPADYAASLEMLEIFQEASEGTQYVNTALSPSASLSVVRVYEDANNLLYFIPLEFVKIRLLILDVLMSFLRWATVWGGMKWWCFWPASCHSQSSINWPNWGSYWEEGWLTPFLAQVVFEGLSGAETPPRTSSMFPTKHLGKLVAYDCFLMLLFETWGDPAD